MKEKIIFALKIFNLHYYMTFFSDRKIYFFLSFSLSVFLSSFSLAATYAENYKEVHWKHEQKFDFNPGARTGSPFTVNEILQLISEGSGKLRVFTSYQLNAEIILSTRDTLLENNALYIEIKDFSIEGDTSYRDFSLTSNITPPYLDLRMHLKASDSEVLQDIVIENIKWEGMTPEDSLTTFSVHEDKLSEDVSIEITNVRFHYGEDFPANIHALRNSLESYYEADQLLDQTMELLESIIPQDYERAIHDDFKVCEAELAAGTIAVSPLWEILTGEQDDPLHIEARLDTLTVRTTAMRDTFNGIISRLDKHLYESGKQYLTEGDTLKALNLFERVLVQNPLHIPAHIQLGRNELLMHESQKAMNRFEELLGVVSLPAQWKDDAVAFAQEIFEREISVAVELMEEGRFLDALNRLKETEKFCQNLHQWNCPVTLDEKMSDAHFGMYKSYLSVATRAYTNGNYSFAVTYAESAWEYQQNNAKYIASPEEVTVLFQLITDGYFVQINEAFESNDFPMALKLSEEVADLCEIYSSRGIFCKEDAELLVQKAKEAKTASERMVIPLVLAEPATDRDEMNQDKAVEEVKDLISEGHLKAWAGETHEAREYLNRIMQLAIRYDLRKDTILNERILNLTEMIAAKECELTYRELQSILAQINDYLIRGYYSEAGQNYSLAVQLNESARNCPWSLSDSLEALSFIKNVTAYQKLLHEAQSAYFNAGQHGFDTFIEKYEVADEYYNAHQLKSHGVEHQSLYEFSAGSSNSALMKASIRYLSEKGYHPEVIELFSLLKEQGFDARELRELQDFAGSKMAAHLYALKPDLDASEFIREKTDNDAWLRIFSRSFSKNWP